MEEVIEQAKRLAELIEGHVRTKAFREAAAAVQSDPVASRAQEAYAKAIETVHRAEAEGRAIEPDQKRAVAKAAEDVRHSPVLVRMLQAHAAYVEMMEIVQQVLSDGPGAGDEHGHEHGPGCDHGHDDAGHAADEPAAPRSEEPPGKSGGILWTP
jgi:hypothetical protein